MKPINHPKRPLMSLVLVSLGLLCSTAVLFAEEESAIIADYQKLLLAADPKLAQEAMMRQHSKPPTEQEVQKFVESLGLAAVNAMDRAADLEGQYPQSVSLPSVRRSLTETLVFTFGMKELPVPQSRAANVEVYVRRLLSQKLGEHEVRDDRGLYLVLYTVAASLPKDKQFALYQELSREPSPEPARTKAQKALIDLERLGKSLDISFTAVDGRKVSLAELKGKVVLIDFWSTTCAPCVRMLPDLKELYARHNIEGFEVIGISLDSDKDVLTRFIEKHKIPWPDYFDAAGPDSPLAKTYGIRGIPVLWLVDRRGLLRHLDARQQLGQKVELLLSEQ